jgi:hypothetical protein
MKKILIIGDSHTLRLRNSIDNLTSSVEECLWGENDSIINSNCIQNHISKMVNSSFEIFFSGHRGKTAYKGSCYDEKNYPCLKKIINDDFIIMPWFGYIDIKQFMPLPQFKKSEIVVKKYIENTLQNFKNNSIRFIEPLPQFINPLGSGLPLLNIEDRYPHQKQYIEQLRDQCQKLGLEKPINISDILSTDLLSESFECHNCKDCLSPEYVKFKLDHPKKEYFKKIIDEIIKKYI